MGFISVQILLNKVDDIVNRNRYRNTHLNPQRLKFEESTGLCECGRDKTGCCERLVNITIKIYYNTYRTNTEKNLQHIHIYYLYSIIQRLTLYKFHLKGSSISSTHKDSYIVILGLISSGKSYNFLMDYKRRTFL